MVTGTYTSLILEEIPMKKISKGNYGYTLSHRKFQILKLSIFVALAASIFIVGFVTTKTTKNVLTIVAIVGALPISKEAVAVIMSFKRKPMDSDLYEKISQNASGLVQAYELLFTTEETAYPVEAAIIEGADLICYVNEPKVHIDKLQAHLVKILESNHYKQNVKIFTDEKKFFERLSALAKREKQDLPYEANPIYPDLNRDQLIRQLLLAISI